jgi:hypothetical protein
VNPIRDLLDHMISSTGAQALFGAGFLLTLFGSAGLLLRPDPSPAFLLFAAVTAAAGAVALVLGLGAWGAALGDRHDVVRRRVRLGSWWVAGSVAALILALLLP